jgi:hypothetical protein
VSLNAGSNTIRIQGSGQGGFNLDRFCVSGGGCSTPPSLVLGTPSCTNGSVYSVGFTAQSGATVTASAGSVQGSSVVNVPLGTNVVVTASQGGCSSQQTANAPTNCNTSTSTYRVAIIGNSITEHPPYEGWGGPGNYGMAASSQSNDYVHRLIPLLENAHPQCKVFYTGAGAFWESAYRDSQIPPNYQQLFIDPMTAFFGNNYTTDLVLISLSENIEASLFDSNKFNQQLDQLISVCNPKPGAKIVVRNSFWANKEASDIAFQNYAQTKGYVFVNLDAIRERADYKASQYSNTGVAHHPNDAGMQAIATYYWNAIQ